MPHGVSWSRISSTLPSAPAATARAMKVSGSSTNTSTRTVRVPAAAGVSQPLFSGSPRKNGAPSTANPTTPPRFHSSVAPSAAAYHFAAAVASDTASITEMTGRSVRGVIVGLLRKLSGVAGDEVGQDPARFRDDRDAEPGDQFGEFGGLEVAGVLVDVHPGHDARHVEL